MKKRIVATLAMVFFTIGLFAQNPSGITYRKAISAPPMQWVCPEIEKYTNLLKSLQNDDEKVYAKNVMWRIDLVENPHVPNDKYIVTRALLKIENPMFNPENLINYIDKWIKSEKKWKITNKDMAKKMITYSPSINVASWIPNPFNSYKATINPILSIYLVENNGLMVEFVVNRYTITENTALNRTYKVTEMFPFVEDSKYKNTCALAFVNTYKTFWDFISKLHHELNSHFCIDRAMINQLQDQEIKMANQLRYKRSDDSLRAIYGELTKMLADESPTPDVNKELRFYEAAKKLVFMGRTIDFKDIYRCEIIDDPEFIPGRTTTTGGVIYFWGIGVGNKQTTKTPDKVIHNYVVDVEIDNLRTPFIRISTGHNQVIAKDIAGSFNYILRHKKDSNNTNSPKNSTKGSKRR